ncbi:MAG: hypothetical protein RLZ44_1412 [Pseudomonadota bacterium]
MGSLRHLRSMLIVVSMAGCGQAVDGYIAASAISADGFAKRQAVSDLAQDRPVKLWGFVDHHNLYGDARAREVLGGWWGGEGPKPGTWRFDLKARAEDSVGKSFAVYVPNDPGRDRILERFVQDATSQRPTKVFLSGRISTFEAPTNLATPLGLYLELQSSADIRFAPAPGD